MSDILILGDICPDNNYRRFFDNNPYGPFDSGLVEFIKSHENVIANLECPATRSGDAIIKTGPNIIASPDDICVLKKVGISHLSLANNHILDFGSQGVYDTLDVCNRNDIKTVGGGNNINEAAKPVIIETLDHRVGLFAFAEEEFNLAGESQPGANHFDPYTSLEMISKLKCDVDRIIVLYHGGIEHYRYPSPELQKKCRAMVRYGADLVLCQHSHCIGTIERYNDSTIVYGQGNTSFGYRSGDSNWNEGLAISYTPGNNSISLRLMNATPQGLVLADYRKNEERLSEISKDSEKCYDNEILTKRWLLFCREKKSLNLPLIYGKSRIYNKLNRVLKNKLINIGFGKKAKMITLELIRCEAHHEVMKTILEDELEIH